MESAAPAQNAHEPLLAPDRLQLFPIRYEDIWGMYKQAESAFWTAEEVDLATDVKQIDTLTPDERHYVFHVLMFFADADGIVYDNIDRNLGAEITLREAKAFYGFQQAVESIHNETYGLMIHSLIKDSAERERAAAALATWPAIQAKAAWALKYQERAAAPLPVRLLAYVIVEYVFFSASFAAIFWLRKRGLLPGLCFANELISRDEALHAQFGIMLLNRYVKERPAPALIAEMVRAAVDIECAFVRESLPVRLIGMNDEAMCQYVRFVADHMLASLGEPKIFGDANPFEWMELISLQGKTNFFEKRVGEYAKAGVGAAGGHEAAEAGKAFALDEDF